MRDRQKIGHISNTASVLKPLTSSTTPIPAISRGKPDRCQYEQILRSSNRWKR